MGKRRREMEELVINPDFWAGRRVLLTGHTGFKGAWASLLLRSLGAEVYGFALAPDDDKSLFVVAGVEADISHHIGDVRDLAALSQAIAASRPEVVLHMAAQSLVRMSYAQPVETYDINVMGTVHLLEAVRHAPSVRAVVVVTSDKCYENLGWVWGYRETDQLGGHDPYSNSKACAELVTDGYRRSYFHTNRAIQIASGRAGNVIGGGDWAQNRLVPDAMRAWLSGDTLPIRNPHAVRPWQHVLDPVIGYLVLAERLVENGSEFAEAWNFGPSAASEVSVERILAHLVRLWGGSARWERDEGPHPHEAAYLKLDCSKSNARLGWRPILDLGQTLRLTIEWYSAFAAGRDMRAFSRAQIAEVLSDGLAANRARAGCV